MFPSEVLWFRGQAAHQNWPLVPAVHRDFDSEREKNMCQLFMSHAQVRRSTTCPPVDQPGQWLALMQHYGLPTRLLDWTESLLVAAYFAIADHPSGDDGIIWALAPGRMNQHNGPEPGIYHVADPKVLKVIVPAFKGGMPLAETYAVFTPQIDLRMMVQHGQYTLHGSPAPIEQHAHAEKFLRGFLIPWQSKLLMRGVLHIMGIHKANLFPDLHNLAHHLAEHHRPPK
ncbi:MAG: FRG domain-containing protein [Anaerolineae bacterium]|nr:FRG domain-containing protein [Phycisphaerae bacterium]